MLRDNRIVIGVETSFYDRVYRHTLGQRGGMSRFAREAIEEKLARETPQHDTSGTEPATNTAKRVAVTASVLVASIVWSCVMSQSAKAFQPTTWEVLNLPADQLRKIEAEGRKKKYPLLIDIRTIPSASQLALISISNHPLCVTMTTKLRSSTARFNVHDFAILRDLQLVTRGEGGRWHNLTDDGKTNAHKVAALIANEMGLHETWSTVGNKYFRTTHCTCGWSTRLYSRRFDAGCDHSERVSRHLAEAAQAVRPAGST